MTQKKIFFGQFRSNLKMDLYVDYFPLLCHLALPNLDMVFPQGWICLLIIVKWHSNTLMV